MSNTTEALAKELTDYGRGFPDGPGLFGEAAAELRRLAAVEADLRAATRENLENYEFQRNKADRATATIYDFHYAMKDAGWHPGRTDDKLTDIIRAKGKQMAELSADVEAKRERITELVSELVDLVAENETLRADAERYRWLRDKSAGGPEVGTYSFPEVEAWVGDVPRPVWIDQAIDEARKV